MSWIVYVILSVISFTTLNLIQRLIAIDSKNERALAILFNAFASIFALTLFAFTNGFKSISLPTDYKAWIGLLFAVIFYGLFERLRFIAAKHLEVSLFTTILSLTSIVAFTGSIFLYNEQLTLHKAIGGILIFCAIILVSVTKDIKNTKNVSKKGLLEGVLAAVILGLAWMLDKFGTHNFGAATYSIFVWPLPIIIILLPKIKLSDLKIEFKLASWKIALIALLNVLAYLFQLKAFAVAEATKVIPLIQTDLLLTVLLGIFLLKEKDNMNKKICAAILAFIGAYFLV